MTLFNRKK